MKWKQLEHKGPYFSPAYEPLPDGVHFFYDGEGKAVSIPGSGLPECFGLTFSVYMYAEKIR